VGESLRMLEGGSGWSIYEVCGSGGMMELWKWCVYDEEGKGKG